MNNASLEHRISRSPVIRKAKLVRGDTLCFRDACIADAEFILSLRTDEKKSRHLNKTSEDVVAQRAWLANYACSENEAYFIIEHDGQPIGTMRLHDPRGASLCMGSFILKDRRPRNAAMESALMSLAYAVDDLQFESVHFDVRKGNERVFRFYERFGAARRGEHGDNYIYSLSLQNLQDARQRFKGFLSSSVLVSRDES